MIKTGIICVGYHCLSNLLPSLVGKERGAAEGAFGWDRSGINMRQRWTTFQLWSEWIILWNLMEIIINYFREQEGQCKWKSHNVYPIPIDYARVEFWKIRHTKKVHLFHFKNLNWTCQKTPTSSWASVLRAWRHVCRYGYLTGHFGMCNQLSATGVSTNFIGESKTKRTC